MDEAGLLMDLVAISTALAALIKSLAWPIVTGLGLYFFRPSVSKLLDRITKGEIGPSGAKFEGTVPNQSGTESPQKESEEAAKEITDNQRLPMPDAYLDSLSQPTIDTVEREYSDNIDVQKKWLARILALAISQRAHEETHRVIFGSQLMLLYKTNSSGGIISDREAKSIYTDAVMSFREIYKNLKFEAWIGFLKTRGLIEDAEVSGEPYFKITLGGKSYLQYVIERQLPTRDFA